MKELIKGANAPLAATGKVRIRLIWRGAPVEIDFACFALDASERVLADDWFVFYNQLTSPGDAIRLDPQRAEFLINLEALPGAVRKCLFIATSESHGFRSLEEIAISAVSATGDSSRFRLTEPTNGRSLLLAELYRYHDVWKIRAKGEGLKHDLASLAGMFGVFVLDETHHPATGHDGTSSPLASDRLVSNTVPADANPPPRPTPAPGLPIITGPLDPRPISPPTLLSETAPTRVIQTTPTADPTDGASRLPYDRHEKLKTYATLAIAFGSLTTAITTLITQCTSHAPVVLVQPLPTPPSIQQPAPTTGAPALKPAPAGEKSSTKSRLPPSP